jgi:hypothetical protein
VDDDGRRQCFREASAQYVVGRHEHNHRAS